MAHGILVPGTLSGLLLNHLPRSDRCPDSDLRGGSIQRVSLLAGRDGGSGAATTAVVLVIIVLAKFKQGAWMKVVFVPALVTLLERINHHYRKDGGK